VDAGDLASGDKIILVAAGEVGSLSSTLSSDDYPGGRRVGLLQFWEGWVYDNAGGGKKGGFIVKRSSWWLQEGWVH
jgi:hypothetical protein